MFADCPAWFQSVSEFLNFITLPTYLVKTGPYCDLVTWWQVSWHTDNPGGKMGWSLLDSYKKGQNGTWALDRVCTTSCHLSADNSFRLHPVPYRASWFVMFVVLCLVAQLCPTLCNPLDSSLPGSSFHCIPQARICEWVALSFSRGSSRPRGRTCVSRVSCRFFTHWAIRDLCYGLAQMETLVKASLIMRLS